MENFKAKLVSQYDSRLGGKVYEYRGCYLVRVGDGLWRCYDSCERSIPTFGGEESMKAAKERVDYYKCSRY